MKWLVMLRAHLQNTHGFLLRLALGAAALLTLALLAAPTASAQRGVPVGLYNVNNQVMNSSGYVYAIRFVI
ncbi:MAG TPA: hypothetical protein VIS51_09230, partial [Solirubrobacterales bacterium]